MARYRDRLPQLGDDLFLGDSGMETDFIFNRGIDLPYFSSICLMETEEGRATVRDYYLQHAEIARRHHCGFIPESATWRASPDWGNKLGLSRDALASANRVAIALLAESREAANLEKPFVISACIGPRGDGYVPGALMSADEAASYHAFQADIFAETQADLVTGMTITNTPEAIGISRAASSAGMPVAISFTLETDGRLPTGQSLAEAIMEVDFESTRPPAYYMINCAHPTHFANILDTDEPWINRLKGLRANASKRSHAELDEAPDLDSGDPQALGRENAELRRMSPGLTVLGGCCGTDCRHIEEIAKAAA